MHPMFQLQLWLAALAMTPDIISSLGAPAYRLLLRIDNNPAWLQAVGALLAVGVAIYVPWTQRRNQIVDNRSRERTEADRLKHAVWQDVYLTLRVIYNEYKDWSAPEFLGAKQIYKRTVEHLRPTVFEANLSRIGIFEPKEATLLLLFHDNLRLAREYISAFEYFPGQHATPNLPPGARDEALEHYKKTLSAELVTEIAALLSMICKDARDFLLEIDPRDELRKNFSSPGERSDGWYDELIAALGNEPKSQLPGVATGS